MPSRSSNGKSLTSFAPLPRPERQVRFPNQRRTVKPVRRSLPLSFEQPPSSESRRTTRQSTLTQMPEFLPPSSGKVMVGISSDEDEDYEDPRPKKRRRQSEGKPRSTLKREKSSTLTQMDFFSSAECLTKVADSEQDEGMDSMEHVVASTKAAKDKESGNSSCKRTTRDQKLNKIESQQLSIEIPESSQLAPGKPEPEIVQETQHTRQQFLSTPRKNHFTEIPSSQTPSSIGLSTRNSDHALRFRDPDKSPLKERSGNVRFVSPTRQQSKRSGPIEIENDDENGRPPMEHEREDESTASEDEDEDEDYDPDIELFVPTAAEESQPMTLKMLQKVHLASRKISLNDTTRVRSSTNKEGILKPALPPLTQRIPSTSAAPAPHGILKRHATVQDSQTDDIDLEDFAVGETQFNDSNEYEGQEEPATYDPANTALDRDAARFRWTQTQANNIFSQVYDMGQEADNLDADDAELEPGLLNVAPSSSAVEVVELAQNYTSISENVESENVLGEDLGLSGQQPHASHAVGHTIPDPESVPDSQTRQLPATVPDSDVESGDEDLEVEYHQHTKGKSKSGSKSSQRNSTSMVQEVQENRQSHSRVPSTELSSKSVTLSQPHVAVTRAEQPSALHCTLDDQNTSQPFARFPKPRHEVEAVQVPSSPPVLSEPPMYAQEQPPSLRPSQISTYMSTQSSARRDLRSGHANEQEKDSSTKGLHITENVDKIASDSLMSSPLPLPPSTFPSSQFDYQESLVEKIPDKLAAESDTFAGSETQLPALSDFSIPRPPPPSASKSPFRHGTKFYDSLGQSQRHTNSSSGDENDKFADRPPPSRQSEPQIIFTSQTDGSLEGFATAPTSPVALPPWSDVTVKNNTETNDGIVKRDENGETQLPSLMDFSLPPPPPMSSLVPGDSEL